MTPNRFLLTHYIACWFTHCIWCHWQKILYLFFLSIKCVLVTLLSPPSFAHLLPHYHFETLILWPLLNISLVFFLHFIILFWPIKADTRFSHQLIPKNLSNRILMSILSCAECKIRVKLQPGSKLHLAVPKTSTKVLSNMRAEAPKFLFKNTNALVSSPVSVVVKTTPSPPLLLIHSPLDSLSLTCTPP